MEGNIYDEKEWLDHVDATKQILDYQIKTHRMLEVALGLTNYPADFTNAKDAEIKETDE